MRESWADRVRHGEVLIGHFGAVGSAAKRAEEDEDEHHPLPVEPPRLVVDHTAEEEEDPFAQEADEATGKVVYAATKTVMGRNSADACFITDTVPDAYPWLYLVKWRGSRRHNRLTLWWPGARVEVEGENLRAIYTLVMTRRASIWRCFKLEEHVEPKAGEPRISAIRIVAVEG